jgi:hypothetical protein
MLVALALSAAGCGDDDNASGASVVTVETGSLSKQQFIKKVNKLCLDEQTKLYKETVDTLKAGSKAGARPSNDLYKKTLNTLFIPGMEAQVKEIQAIGAPPGDETEIERILTSLQGALEKGRTLPKSETVKLQQLLTPGGKMAKKYGIGNCAFP